MHNNFFNRIFPKKWGGPGGPTQAQSACPHFLQKILLKKLLCIVCVCKKWHCRFFEAFDLPHYESVRVWVFLVCKKIDIRVMWTFTASKKESVFIFARAFFCRKIAFVFSSIFKLWKYKGFFESNPIDHWVSMSYQNRDHYQKRKWLLSVCFEYMIIPSERLADIHKRSRDVIVRDIG